MKFMWKLAWGSHEIHVSWHETRIIFMWNVSQFCPSTLYSVKHLRKDFLHNNDFGFKIVFLLDLFQLEKTTGQTKNRKYIVYLGTTTKLNTVVWKYLRLFFFLRYIGISNRNHNKYNKTICIYMHLSTEMGTQGKIVRWIKTRQSRRMFSSITVPC